MAHFASMEPFFVCFLFVFFVSFFRKFLKEVHVLGPENPRKVSSISPPEKVFYSSEAYSCPPKHFPLLPVHRFRPAVAAKCGVLLEGVSGEQRLSSGVLEFRSLRVTRDSGKRRKPGGSRAALALHKHRVQASNFGSEESVNAMKHGEEVRELELLKRNKDRHSVDSLCHLVALMFWLGIWITFASIDLESWFWNKNLILLFPSSDDPFSWENLYLHRTAWNTRVEKH